MSAQEIRRLFNTLDKLLLEQPDHSGEGRRLPNQEIIIKLISAVEQYPDLWEAAVNRVNKTADLENWQAADIKINQEMQAPHRIPYSALLREWLKPIRGRLISSSVKNSFEMLESACEGLIVYDHATPPDHGERSEILMKMKDDDVKLRATRSMLRKDKDGNYHGEFEEAAPLILPVKYFNSFVEREQQGNDVPVRRNKGNFENPATKTDFKDGPTPQSSTIKTDSGEFKLDSVDDKFIRIR